MDALIVFAAFLAGWCAAMCCFYADLASLRRLSVRAREAVQQLRSDVADERYRAGFAAGVAAHDELSADSRSELIARWSK
jgi:hypothetical protein